MELVPAFTARTLSGDRVRLATDLPVTEDPRRASGDFQADQPDRGRTARLSAPLRPAGRPHPADEPG